MKDKRELLKMLITGSIRPGSIPAVGPGGMLIETASGIFTDTKNGESFQGEQLAQLIEPFKRSPFFEWHIGVGESKENFLEHEEDIHPNARTPYLTEMQIEGGYCYQFKVINIQSISTPNAAIEWALKNQVNN